MTALRHHLASLSAAEREEIALERYSEVANLADRYRVSTDAVRAELKALEPKKTSARWQFEWIAGVNVAQGKGLISVKGLKVGMALFECSHPGRPYVWPTQQTIAELCGWSAKNRRGVFEGLSELSDQLGALSRIRFLDLPVSVQRVATTSGKGERKGRKDPRSMAYKMVPVDTWKKLDVSPMGKHIYVSPVEALNTKVQHQPASPDSFNTYSCSTSNVESVETYTHPLMTEESSIGRAMR